MYVVALDLSTKPGVAVFKDGLLLDSYTIWDFDGAIKKSHLPYPENYVTVTNEIAKRLFYHCFSHIEKSVPGSSITVVIEETTASSSNYSQKQLEFIHYAFLSHVFQFNRENSLSLTMWIKYIRDGVWKDLTGARQSKEERSYNAKISRIKQKIKKETGKQSHILAKIDGKVVAPLDRKDYYIRAANQMFDKKLEKKDENEAAALLLGKSFLMGAPLCDGTSTGGLRVKSKGIIQS
jgi:hypothetical protein